MDDALRHILYVTARWLHVVCTTLVVGGTLFFEFVVPVAIEDLKKEQQMAVFGKARWVFRRVVWVCAVLLLLSGAVTLQRMWDVYDSERFRASMPYALAHVGIGIVALGLALLLTARGRPPEHALLWLRITLVLLLLTILAATLTRHIRLTARERAPDAQPAQAPPPGPNTRGQNDD
ncbi:MAG TPA: hypothetical protein VEA69_14440 [Tepidisphaeraceae bacterium]|nr:hypothetical protein [Tepidisphaeraceae bacterium]